jgi:hypothetical protein
MQQIPWKADSRSFGQEISSLLCNSQARYSFHKNPPQDLILSQINPIYILTNYFFKIYPSFCE